ncbi:hypothetical protein ACFL0X_00715 [Nanoarchaeota archaeon]
MILKNKLMILIIVGVLLNFISAQGCCLDTCQDAENQESCSGVSEYQPISCEDTNECGSGCCYDEEYGSCGFGTRFKFCDGIWNDDPSCSDLPECAQGCCVIRNDARLTTRKECEIASQSSEFDFREGVTDEGDCVMIPENELQGACVFEGGGCTRTTESDCSATEGEFHEGWLCSHESLKDEGVDCIFSEDTICFNERVHFLDSCNQIANIYEYGKRETQNYWNEIKYPEDSCGDDKGNVNSLTCGNCKFPRFSSCSLYSEAETEKPELGEYVCKDLGCYDEENEKQRLNTESWCVFDAYIGDGKDIPGSIHWKRYCVDGEIKFEPCGDYRNSICAENKESKTADCRDNYGWMCLGIDNEEECEKNFDCEVNHVEVGDNFHFDACVPKYPIGFDFESEDLMLNGEDVCKLAHQSCVLGNALIQPRQNEVECSSVKFVEEMNDFCMSLGDCGGYINLGGEYYKGYKVKNVVELEDYGEIINATFYEQYLKKKEWMEIPEPMSSNVQPPAERPSSYDQIDIFNKDKGSGSKDKIKFKCYPWRPPSGGENCEKCNEDPLKPCTPYRCKSLGASCEIANWGVGGETDNQICVDLWSGDDTPPIISLGEVLTEGYGFENEVPEEKRVEIKSEEGDGRIEEFVAINFILKTDERARCKWKIKEEFVNNPETNEYDGDGAIEESLDGLDHTFMLESYYSSLDDRRYIENSRGELQEATGEVNMYVRCEDAGGNFNMDSYTINFPIKAGPDESPVKHYYTEFEPEDGSFLEYGINETSLVMWVNEPAECRYSKIPNTVFEEMTSNMDCSQEIEEKDENGLWVCDTTLTNLIETENKFYFRCKDMSENDNKQDYEYTLYTSLAELNIDSLLPTGEIKDETTELKVTTSGGASNDGICECEWKWGTSWISFSETDSNEHTQNFNVEEMDYNIPVKCEDKAENIAEGNIVFKGIIDTEAPKVVRAFKQNDKLKLITDEEAVCKYGSQTCEFDWTNGTLMTAAGFSKEHSAEWINDFTYYVKCEDFRGKRNEGCAIIIKASSF